MNRLDAETHLAVVDLALEDAERDPRCQRAEWAEGRGDAEVLAAATARYTELRKARRAADEAWRAAT